MPRCSFQTNETYTQQQAILMQCNIAEWLCNMLGREIYMRFVWNRRDGGEGLVDLLVIIDDDLLDGTHLPSIAGRY